MDLNERVREVGEGIFILRDAKAVVEFTGSEGLDVNFSGQMPLRQSGLTVAPWGADNLQPQKMLELVSNNHLKPQLLLTARDLVLGSRLGTFQRTLVDGKLRLEPVIDLEMEDWFESVEGDELLSRSAGNLEYFANYFTVITLNSNKKVEAMIGKDCNTVRAQATSARKPQNYYLHPNWRTVQAGQVDTVPAYDPADPTRFGQFMVHGRDWTPGQKYYDWAPWYGTRKWTEVSNKIPAFHASGLDNGYNIKYHIKIPANYFDQYGTPEARKKAESDLMVAMNEMLSGVENVDKAFVSKYQLDQMGKAQPGWSIEPIENKMSDSAYEAVNNQANIAHTSGHGIDPSLAGIDTGAKLGGSGSEKRISYQLHIAMRTSIKRKILLRQFNIAKKIMGFNPQHLFGFEDIDITTIAENPTGQQKVVNKAM